MDKTLPDLASAVAAIEDGMTVMIGGFGGSGAPIELIHALIDRFMATGHPRDLTFYTPVGQGNFKDKGMAHFAHDGMTKRIVAAHYGVGGPRLAELVRSGRVLEEVALRASENKRELAKVLHPTAVESPTSAATTAPGNLKSRLGGFFKKGDG